MKRVLICIVLVSLIGALMLPGCGPRKIRVASKLDAEGAILAQLIIQKLRDAGYEVVDKTWMGPTDVLRKAITSGDIDIYPEYTGNGALWFDDADWQNWSRADKNEVAARLNALETLNNTGVEWLSPAPANNKWALTVNSDVANEKGLKTIKDFSDYVKEPGSKVQVYGSKEFFNSKVALPLFEQKYEFKLKKEQEVTVSSPTYAENLVAFYIDPDTVYASMAYTTDRYLEEGMNNTSDQNMEKLPLRVLDDNQNAQPPYYPTPLVRSEILKEYPEIRTILDNLFQELNNSTLQQLNADAVQKFPDEVARDYLVQKGLLEHPEIDESTYDTPPPDLFEPGDNEIGIEIVNTKVTVPPKEIRQTDFFVDGKFMHNVRIVGWFMTSGGAFNDVEIAVLNDIDFTNWENFRETENPVFLSAKITKTQIEEEITEPGSYHLASSNRFSEFSYKNVKAKVYLFYTLNEDADSSNTTKAGTGG